MRWMLPAGGNLCIHGSLLAVDVVDCLGEKVFDNRISIPRGVKKRRRGRAWGFLPPSHSSPVLWPCPPPPPPSSSSSWWDAETGDSQTHTALVIRACSLTALSGWLLCNVDTRGHSTYLLGLVSLSGPSSIVPRPPEDCCVLFCLATTWKISPSRIPCPGLRTRAGERPKRYACGECLHMLGWLELGYLL
jgi:hypothetical protein